MEATHPDRILEHILYTYDTIKEQVQAVIKHGLASDEEQADFLLEDYDYRYGSTTEDGRDQEVPTDR